MTTNDLQQIQVLLDTTIQNTVTNVWKHWDFWLAVVLGVGGLYFSIKAFVEARQAKRAATEAGQTVRIQTITIELTEISQKLDKLPEDITYSEARDFLNEITRRLGRIVAPFENDTKLSEKIRDLLTTLSKARQALRSVAPTNPTQEEVPHTVYYAVESDLITINSLVAALLGLFEKRTIKLGDDNEDE